MATMPFVGEGKCVSVEWDFLQGLLAKPPTLPCLQNLRKEKSRNAARSRRGKENFEFFELAKLLPLPGAITSQLDKASVIRLTISYLHMRHFANHGDPPWGPLLEGGSNCTKVHRSSRSLATDMFEQHLGAHVLQSLDGFVFVVSHEGRFLYISETVSIYLGLSQVELTGSSIFDYIHPADHLEMADCLGIRPHLRAEVGCQGTHESTSSSTSSLAETPEPAPTNHLKPEDESWDRGFFIRMKSTLTKRGLHVKSSGYKVIHITGRIRFRLTLAPGHTRSLQRPLGLVALAHTLPPSTLNEVRMESQMFVFRMNMDLQVTYCENRISEYMDLSPAEVVGHTCYQFIYAEDLESLRQSHEDLLRKGQVVTNYYRWLQRRGGFLWVQSCATVSVNHKAPHERNVIWVNYVLSRTEFPDTPLDLLQLPESLRDGHMRVSSAHKDASSQAQGTAATQHIKCSSGKNGSGSKVREAYSLPPNGQSEEKRKRAQQSNPKSSPLEKRQRKEFLEKREGSPSASSDQGSDSEGEGGAERRCHADGGRVKCEEGASKHGKEAARSGADMPHNGRAVIQQLKSGVTSAAPCIKTEQNLQATGGRWGHVKPPLHTPAGAQNGDGPALSMPDSAMTPPSGETPHRGLLAPPSPTLSPPVAGSPLPREERGLAGGRGPDFELLQRLAVGSAAGRVLFHPLALGPQGTQSLYAPSTIRYAPAELGPGHPAPEALPSDHSKPPAFFPHLQRIAALPPFSGFSSSEPSFPPGLPFCINGLRGTAASEED
ncbi:neuronal PAS domain-containing protein 1 [Paramormyrops kingsleyae]|uniref:Neuronal PAS domain-containing protein 1 n=1 Tax=Paramormyrops kingsleyae TaxID=1676925 RepID=A0A3B3SDG5_9TELE|nr:neuronal PAS domain-containing protein 1 [Paramormyrops kingsleyae]XP_023669426.1 neuronal PAS domain-containing protein 1 [Paramormyrops kingsleyae]XP_023669427.1 neuronal PAS domain-containing protein 1 [Paramormyrops kingsleyae]XP_023669428.1 neuronal PAS domain-containing protein 1 [Paramormyrops kingsleyae]XP_023669429.1 neuronal PAS domain-containing protein 1 [Paramormyrops kingsleyae]